MEKKPLSLGAKVKRACSFKERIVNSHAVGMTVAKRLDFEIDFARNPISGSAVWFLVIIPKFIFTAIFEIM